MASEPPAAETLRAKLAAELDRVPWSEVRSHALADRLFLVEAGLDLLDAAVAIALDRSAEVAGWIEDGAIQRPSREDAQRLDGTPERELHCVIVQPFVLAQHPDSSEATDS